MLIDSLVSERFWLHVALVQAYFIPRDVLSSTGVGADDISEVILGQALPALQGQNPTRQVVTRPPGAESDTTGS